MKKRLDADKLTNELAGSSAFFRPTPKPEPTPESEATPARHTAQPSQVTPEPRPTSDVTTSRRHSVTTSSESPVPAGFDINRPTSSRDSLRLSTDETKALDALRSTLKWDYDLSVSKNDICRVALHALLEEFAAKGERSGAVARLKLKLFSR